MSRRYEDNCGYYPNAGYGNVGFPGGLFGSKGCACSLPTLIILILIILQFSKKGKRTSSCSSSSSSSYSSGHGKLIDNGILFIIALFYLSCANPCKRGY
ncbi:hypothetical protein CPAST_c29060 [Clostridium pasteurianum DSM 525 = ATCC 6013]|uniref:Sporulation protein YjcZ n=1 Tax=Clostridium pasteurianum DSM 525 = ATCC 6013 TaxID=1262449 RepID=A0A0H3J6X3_CLOPA|nr:hypothetical protein [Clostridium pasteurianum]AJA48972.1 hypothetical protein CPAST_c29060 [Clostridium pasteurianum DSM 525 = ATCC 6013]AJA52960.1 hypothetical protein CLPA_c29060 [Clostridium pasteurianum DSM 525 = ATCC 6013]AOZ76179.1 hypothetical protein AQ983_14125 [Clostridium pasteurianum DSM 525 = ATCC 6013]AOZ79975.1 hypothetical protein AQ984_14120 [Clostridium pasteurianum]ELP60268.1 hypothetical protein F502_06512 [Clostridium pasteurianum DSM 525 = ATCC 6013]